MSYIKKGKIPYIPTDITKNKIKEHWKTRSRKLLYNGIEFRFNEDLANYLNISKQTLCRWLKSGKLQLGS